MAVFWFLSVLAMTNVLGQEVESQDSVVYRLTIRDFLPSHCIRKSEYELWWNYDSYVGLNDSVYEDYETLPDNFYANVTGLIDFDSSNGPPYVGRGDTILVKHYCPYWTEGMRDGTISGHPDFESAQNSIEDGPSECFYGGVAQTCNGERTSIISPTLTLASSGLPKLQYCNSSAMARCGHGWNQNLDTYMTSRSQFFDAWYNDDAKYNKRVGVPLTLDKNTEGVYSYASTEFFPLQDYNSIDIESVYPDPARAPIWPNAIRDFHSQHYWFTTELHTYFEFSGNESFTFDGDDDFWAFINGKPAIDLGGLHGQERRSIFLANYSDPTQLNLTVGEIYELSVFHAERHFSASHFQVDTTISESCNVARRDARSTAFSLANATDATLSYSAGVEWLQADVLRLTSASATSSSASTWMFTSAQQNVGAGFVASFTFRVPDEGALEGLAFVATRRPEGLVDMPVSTGSGLGFRFLSHTVAVAIDTCADRQSSSVCSEQEIRLHYPTTPELMNDDLNATERVYDGIQRGLNYDAENHTVRIEYLQRPDWIQVFLDDSLYLRQKNFDLETILGGRDAYIGLTSATRDTPSTLEILEFSLETVAVEPSQTDAGDLIPEASTVEIAADGEETAGFTIYTRDFCGNEMDNGGQADYMKAWYIPTRQSGESSRRALEVANETELWDLFPDERVAATIIDNLDGSYTAELSTEFVETFALYACFGPDCGYDWTSLEPLESSSFYSHVDTAVQANALTASPTRSPIDYVAPATTDSGLIQNAAIGGGVAGFLFLLSLVLLFVFRRRWRRDKSFIEEGKLYNLEREVSYDANDEYATVANLVMQTSADILHERARRSEEGTDGDDIATLAGQNRELEEEVRLAKQRRQLQAAKGTRLSRFLGSKGSHVRKQFQNPTDL
ncbi:Protein psiA [Hondaea fermentalgiana]|uniref:Protein psiA n=1 Tax=Hondaea fermentalgiana TaxID=2315210 RepID=A0A2R5GHZ5_9STRA|nr:Protein psiA [Hondaea fermentalgiana]|eukprot:GBG30215.1 Protein psiA [Hondaea fermentalgiana]